MKLPALAAIAMLFAATHVDATCMPDRAVDLLTPAEWDQVAEVEAAIPNASGRLYDISRDGQVLGTLYGTFHSADPVILLPQALVARIADADRVFLETTTAELQLHAQRQQLLAHLTEDPEGRLISEELTPEDWTLLSEVMWMRGYAPEEYDALHPVYIWLSLGYSDCELSLVSDGLPILDRKIEQIAEWMGKRPAGLEDAATPTDLLTSIGREHQLDIAINAAKFELLHPHLSAQILDLYMQGRIVALELVGDALMARLEPEWPDMAAHAAGQALQMALLDTRNRAWLPNMEAAMAEGRTVFAVGASHLPGEVGLVELLRDAGYVVTRIVLEGEPPQ